MEASVVRDGKGQHFDKHRFERLVRERLDPTQEHHSMVRFGVSYPPPNRRNERSDALRIDVQTHFYLVLVLIVHLVGLA